MTDDKDRSTIKAQVWDVAEHTISDAEISEMVSRHGFQQTSENNDIFTVAFGEGFRNAIAHVEKLLDSTELMEALADIEHERWAGWEKYRSRPEVTLLDEMRWERQRRTSYALLSEEEKESDRKEVRKTLACIKSKLGVK